MIMEKIYKNNAKNHVKAHPFNKPIAIIKYTGIIIR